MCSCHTLTDRVDNGDARRLALTLENSTFVDQEWAQKWTIRRQMRMNCRTDMDHDDVGEAVAHPDNQREASMCYCLVGHVHHNELVMDRLVVIQLNVDTHVVVHDLDDAPVGAVAAHCRTVILYVHRVVVAHHSMDAIDSVHSIVNQATEADDRMDGHYCPYLNHYCHWLVVLMVELAMAPPNSI